MCSIKLSRGNCFHLASWYIFKRLNYNFPKFSDILYASLVTWNILKWFNLKQKYQGNAHKFQHYSYKYTIHNHSKHLEINS